jgi:hypothetical protein
MTISSIPDFSVRCFFQQINADYANYAYFDKIHLKLLNQIWFGLPLGGGVPFLNYVWHTSSISSRFFFISPGQRPRELLSSLGAHSTS